MDISIGALNAFGNVNGVGVVDIKGGLPEIQDKNVFKSFFDAAMDVLEETNMMKLDADKWQNDLATGKTDDVLQVMLAQDRAYSSLNFTVQVTNKIIESYREIMRMQI
jgi:flagellar hook-basal body complex protein FliE